MTSSVKYTNLLIRRPSKFLYKYIRQLSIDYRDALIETGKQMLQHPVKTTFYSTNIYLLVHAYYTMPTLKTYKSDLVEFRHQQLLTASTTRNKQVQTYIDTIEKLLLYEQIHFVDCYLFSLIIYKTQHHATENSFKFYENICSYLHLKRNARIIDIGAFNRWFILNRQLRKADIFDETNSEKIAL